MTATIKDLVQLSPCELREQIITTEDETQRNLLVEVLILKRLGKSAPKCLSEFSPRVQEYILTSLMMASC